MAKSPRLSPVMKFTAIFCVLATLCSAAIGFFVYKKMVVNAKHSRVQELTQHRAKLTADNVRVWLEARQSRLMEFTAREPLKTALKSPQKERVASVEILSKSTFNDELYGVRIFRPSEAALDPDSKPPVRFTELGMIRKVERNGSVVPELANIDDKWMLNFVVPISNTASSDGNASTTMGTALLSFTVEGLGGILRKQSESTRITLIQKVAETRDIETLQHGGEGDSIATHSVEIPGTWWRIQAEALPGLLADAYVNVLPAILIVLAVFVILLSLAFLLARWIGKRGLVKGSSVKSGASGLTKGKKAPLQTESIYGQDDILDITINEEDADLLALDDVVESPAEQTPSAPESKANQQGVPDEIFRAYDIRGIFKSQLTKELAREIGRAIGTEVLENNERSVIVARDARVHSPELTEWMIRGILASGCDAINIGTVPTPVMYFATEVLEETSSGVMVTASHNPAEYNGFKMVINGVCRSEDDIKAIRTRILNKDVRSGRGTETRRDLVATYIEKIFSDVALAGDIFIVLDAANGVTGLVAPELFEKLGCRVMRLFCDIDGTFPNHSPDPSIPENLHALVAKVQEVGADLGVAFDGDGDRLVVVTSKGEIIWPDRLLMLFAKDIVSRNPGADVVFDVKSSRHLVRTITSFGGRPIMWKTGHAPMKSKVSETGALVGGEYSGHIFIKDRWYGFDDGMYAAARLVEIITLHGQSLDEIMSEFPISPSTPEIRVPVEPDEIKFRIIKDLVETGDFGDGKISTLDGLRADFQYGWGLIRASNTSSCLTMRFEADDEASIHKLKSLFAIQLKNVYPSARLDWQQQK